MGEEAITAPMTPALRKLRRFTVLCCCCVIGSGLVVGFQIVLGIGIYAVAFYASGRVYYVAAFVVYSYMCYFSGRFVSEENQIASAAQPPVLGFDASACICLLRCVAHKYYAVGKICGFDKAGAVCGF